MQAGVLVVGLGRMGGAIGTNLARSGWPTFAFDLIPQAVGRAVDAGAQAVSSPAEALGKVGYVITCLPDPKAVREAYLGENGIAARLEPGTVVVEMSTIDPAAMREVADAVRRTDGVRVLDVPVSGGVEDAAQGNATLMVGGAVDDVEHARPLLEAMGTIKDSGGVGDATVIKLINNYVAIANITVAAEAVAIAESLGVDDERMYAVLSASGAASYQFNKRIPRAMADDFAARFSLALANKDLQLLKDIVRDETALELPAAEAVFTRFESAMAAGLGGEDMLAILKTYR